MPVFRSRSNALSRSTNATSAHSNNSTLSFLGTVRKPQARTPQKGRTATLKELHHETLKNRQSRREAAKSYDDLAACMNALQIKPATYQHVGPPPPLPDDYEETPTEVATDNDERSEQDDEKPKGQHEEEDEEGEGGDDEEEEEGGSLEIVVAGNTGGEKKREEDLQREAQAFLQTIIPDMPLVKVDKGKGKAREDASYQPALFDSQDHRRALVKLEFIEGSSRNTQRAADREPERPLTRQDRVKDWLDTQASQPSAPEGGSMETVNSHLSPTRPFSRQDQVICRLDSQPSAMSVSAPPASDLMVISPYSSFTTHLMNTSPDLSDFLMDTSPDLDRIGVFPMEDVQHTTADVLDLSAPRNVFSGSTLSSHSRPETFRSLRGIPDPFMPSANNWPSSQSPSVSVTPAAPSTSSAFDRHAHQSNAFMIGSQPRQQSQITAPDRYASSNPFPVPTADKQDQILSSCSKHGQTSLFGGLLWPKKLSSSPPQPSAMSSTITPSDRYSSLSNPFVVDSWLEAASTGHTYTPSSNHFLHPASEETRSQAIPSYLSSASSSSWGAPVRELPLLERLSPNYLGKQRDAEEEVARNAAQQEEVAPFVIGVTDEQGAWWDAVSGAPWSIEDRRAERVATLDVTRPARTRIVSRRPFPRVQSLPKTTSDAGRCLERFKEQLEQRVDIEELRCSYTFHAASKALQADKKKAKTLRRSQYYRTRSPSRSPKQPYKPPSSPQRRSRQPAECSVSTALYGVLGEFSGYISRFSFVHL
ncbi:hypothetical protein V5O48_008313 [Marasmius crinis-equi]|uniref:Uncharacterized protein n=1 Tax=Marasmius crinis-equi TaxID=585013 RepID=A0ABR3FER6_9AGAR